MDAIRALSLQLLGPLSERVEASRADIYRTLMLSRVSLAVLSAACLFAMYLYLRNSSALKQHELELNTLLQAKGVRLEAEVAERTAQLTALTRYLQNAREDERNRLARNLHDDLGALLTSAKLDAARIKSRLAATAPEALELLAHLVGTLNNSIALGRRIIEDLRPSALSNLGLVPTLEILAREFTDQSGIPVHCTLEPVHLEPNAALMVYRLVQEAFTNITKYAAARQVWVNLQTVGGQVTASVRDDGVGFDTTLQRNSAYGLMGMRFRVEAEGGVLVMTSAPGAGTLIQATLPAGAPPQSSQPADL
jgi:signal transduction histidine kinase